MSDTETSPGVRLAHTVEGTGPPLLLLHGFSQTRRAWEPVARRLADQFTVVRPDLPGYGASPRDAAGGAEAMSKRAMAAAVLALMRRLGHERFAVAGHDRGGLVGQRLALDHPEAVSALAVLDIVPVLDLWSALDADGAVGAYHLFLLAQAAPLPERLVGGAPTAFVDSFLDGWCHVPGAISDAARAEYHAAIRVPGAVAAVCDDYRAGAGVDLAHDRADRVAGRRIAAPVLVLWQEPGGAQAPFDPVAIWRRWADDVHGRGLDAGHFLPEERPDEVAAAVAAHCQ